TALAGRRRGRVATPESSLSLPPLGPSDLRLSDCLSHLAAAAVSTSESPRSQSPLLPTAPNPPQAPAVRTFDLPTFDFQTASLTPPRPPSQLAGGRETRQFRGDEQK